MTFPATWTRKTVTGKYLLRDGTPARGQVVFSSPQIVIADGSVILPTKITATLDATGLFSASLPATNDPAISPVGWTWRVQELVAGGGRDFGLVVDYAGTDIDLAAVAPLAVIDEVQPAYGTPGSITGITQAQADARYIQQSAIDAANGVAGLDAGEFVGEAHLPLPPVTLTVLLANKLA